MHPTSLSIHRACLMRTLSVLTKSVNASQISLARLTANATFFFIISFSQINSNITYASRSREIWHKIFIAVTAVCAHLVHALTVDAHSRDRTFVNIWNKMRRVTCWRHRFNNHIPWFGHKNTSLEFSKCEVFPSPGACFSKVPKLFGTISGATIHFLSSQRRGSKPLNFAILLVFLT